MSSFVPRTLEDLAYDFPPDLSHVSASSLNMALRCSEQWRQRYILKRVQPPSLAQLLGRADHKAIEVSMEQKIVSHEDLNVSIVQEMFVDALETAVDEQGGLGELEDTPTSAELDTARYSGREVIAGYHRIISPTVQPVAVEKEFTIDVPGLPVQMNGRIDLIEDHQIIDRKRSKRASKEPSGEWVLQAGIYQLAEPKPYRWHLSVSTKTPQYLTDMDLEAPTPAQEAITLRQLQDITLGLGWLYQKYGADEPWPTTGVVHPWACGFCGYRPNCWAWA